VVARVSPAQRIDPAEVEFVPLRSPGPGGQNVNKVSSAAQLRYDIRAGSLPEAAKQRLLAWPDQRISGDGVVVIKAHGHRSAGRNRADALARLQALVDEALHEDKPRRATRPTRASKERRLQAKAGRSAIKAGRGRVLG
jgi:ribosome-associated protein